MRGRSTNIIISSEEPIPQAVDNMVIDAQEGDSPTPQVYGTMFNSHYSADLQRLLCEKQVDQTAAQFSKLTVKKP